MAVLGLGFAVRLRREVADWRRGHRTMGWATVTAVWLVALTVVLGALELILPLFGMRARGRWLGRRPGAMVIVQPFQVSEDGIYRASTNWTYRDDEPAFATRYRSVRINDMGFREIHPQGTGATVMVIGDSFAWGESARPLTNAFADRLAWDYGYKVFNFGIPGTQPEQYALVAEKYVPILQPAACVVCIYAGNDMNTDLREKRLVIRPWREKLWYVTNSGIFPAVAEDGTVLPPEQAFHRAMNLGMRVSNILRDSVTGTFLLTKSFNFWYRLRVRSDDDRARVNGDLLDALRMIQDACDATGAHLVVFVIPAPPSMLNERNDVRKNWSLLSGLDAFTDGFTEAEYMPRPDDHFSNAGHARAAALIARKLADMGIRPTR